MLEEYSSAQCCIPWNKWDKCSCRPLCSRKLGEVSLMRLPGHDAGQGNADNSSERSGRGTENTTHGW